MSQGRRWNIVSAVIVGAALIAGAAQAGQSPDQVTRKTRLRGGGDDPNVKVAGPINVRTKQSGTTPAPKPPADRVPCTVTFDNDTELFTKAYVDGRYAGTISPFGELTTSAVPGATVLYARADYDDGTADGWGPIRASCQTKYLWRLAD